MSRKGCRKTRDEEGLACFWFGAEAQSSLRDLDFTSISYPARFEKGARTVLGYFRASLRDCGVAGVSVLSGLGGSRVDTPGLVLNTLLR